MKSPRNTASKEKAQSKRGTSCSVVFVLRAFANAVPATSPMGLSPITNRRSEVFFSRLLASATPPVTVQSRQGEGSG